MTLSLQWDLASGTKVEKVEEAEKAEEAEEEECFDQLYSSLCYTSTTYPSSLISRSVRRG